MCSPSCLPAFWIAAELSSEQNGVLNDVRPDCRGTARVKVECPSAVEIESGSTELDPFLFVQCFNTSGKRIFLDDPNPRRRWFAAAPCLALLVSKQVENISAYLRWIGVPTLVPVPINLPTSTGKPMAVFSAPLANLGMGIAEPRIRTEVSSRHHATCR